MRVGFDATPLLGVRSGVGTYTERLVHALSDLASERDLDLDLVATAFSRRGTDALAGQLPPHARVAPRRLPARVLRALWTRAAWPPAELMCGPVDVFHGTNFVAPPTRRAGSVVTVHDLAYLELRETVNRASLAYRDLVPAALRRGATVCAVSGTMAAAIRETYDLAEDRVVVTPLGVDASWFDAPPPPAARLPRAYVLAVGTLEPRKNLATLLDAYRLAAARGTDLPPLVLVGAQGWGDALDTSGIPDDRLVRTGHLPVAELQGTVARASLLAFPSRYEGFGLPPLEALAAGTAVLSADLPVTREVLGDQARFADATRAETLLEGLVTALADPAGTVDTRRRHARAFTWARCATATLAAYQAARA